MGRMDFDIMNEAFRAGNRARKKESVQDAVESVNDIQSQIDRFREQTGIELKIKDGHPYFDEFLDLDDCTGLTSLPAGLKVDSGLNLEGCTGLTSLPPGLEVGGDLYLDGCTGLTSLPAGLEVDGDLYILNGTRLTSLPFDLIVNSNCSIIYDGVLTSFFKKLGIPVTKEGNTKATRASDWRKWQKAHGYLTEAFKAGNKARKKESVSDAAADIHNPLQDQIVRFKEQTGIELEIKDGRPYYKGNCMDFSGNADIPVNLFVEGDFSVSIQQERLPAGLTVTGMLDLEDCKNLTELPPNITACDLKLTCSGIKKVPKDTNITGSFIIYGPHDQDLNRFFREDCGLQPLTVNAGSDYRPDFENRIIGFSWNRWRTVGKPDFDKIHNILTANEAFKAGNRARKKETAQDAVESVDSLEEQVREFEKITGAKLEIKQGIPLATWLNLKDCTELTRLPDGLTVFGNLNLAGCTGLKRLPDGLNVHGYLNLHRCTGLTSLPHGMYITGSLRLSECDGITELPADLKIEIKDIQSNSIYNVPDSLKPFLNRLGITTDIHGNVAAEDWMEHRHLIGKTDEAFKAGNRARKKETAQNTVESVDSIQAQIELFKEQTDKELEIRDGRPYFGRSLCLDDCTGLTGLPAGLKVNGYLSLERCTGLTSLPDGLEVGGGLWLQGCTGLTSLPDNLKVEETLNLAGCTGLTSLPNGLKVRKSLYLIDCAGLTSLPDGLKVGENLDLNGCTGLTSLPFDIVVQGYWIVHSGILTPFFSKLGIRVDKYGDTKAEDWREWQKTHGYLKEAFKAGNRARKKEAITDTVSIGLTPEQQIKLFMADIMKYREWLIQQGKTVKEDTVYSDKNDEYPVGVYYSDGIDDVFMIDGDKVVIRSIVDFTDYPYEIHFPEKVQCNALVNLINCTGLTGLPDSMYVQDHLNLEGCSNLRRLPEDLYVGFDLYLDGCTSLESLPSNFTVNWGDLDLEDCPNIKEIPTSANLVKGRIVFSPDSELHRFFIRNDIGYTTEGNNNPANPRKWNICDFSKWNAWKNGIREAFKAGNRARKKEAVQDTVETFEDMDFPTVMRSPVQLISELARFLYRLGYKVADERELRVPHRMQNDNPIYYYSENFGNSSYGGNYIRISLGRHPVWNERLRRFISTGLILCIEATDRMYYRVQFLPADKEVEESVQFLNCSSEWFEAWEKPDGTRYGKPRNNAALTDNSIPAVWPNLFRNILTAAKHPEYVFVPDKIYTKCWSFKKPSDIDEAFKAGNRARKKEAAQDTVQTTGEYRPVTRELLKDVIDSIIDPEEGPISGKIYRRYDRSITGQCIVNCLNRILELCGYKDMLKAEIAFEDDTCDGVQITDDKNYSVSRLVVQYSRDYVCVLTGSMDTGMPGLLYAYKNLPDILEVHLEGIDSLNADLREYIEKFG